MGPLEGKSASKLSLDRRQERESAAVRAFTLKPRSSEVPSAAGQGNETVTAASSMHWSPGMGAGLVTVIAQPDALVTGSPQDVGAGVGVGLGLGVGVGEGVGVGLGVGDGVGVGVGPGVGVGEGFGSLGSVRTATRKEAFAVDVPALAERL